MSDKTVLKAARFAEENGLWIYNGGTKAKITVSNTTIGILSNGEATNVINVYKTSNNLVHGAPGTPK
jgi:hypothetical protein